MLKAAIVALEAELAELGVGKSFPKDGTAEFFLAYGKGLGLSYLRKLERAGVEHSHMSVKRMYKKVLVATKATEEEIEAAG